MGTQHKRRRDKRSQLETCSPYLGSSECAELVSLLHDVGFPLREGRVSSQLVLDVLHGDLHSTSSLFTRSGLWLLVRFIIV